MSATVAACLTPPGQAALATLGLRGPKAWEAARTLFRRRGDGTLPELPEQGNFWLGRFGGDVADEVVLAVRRGGAEPSLEIHCHGGREVVAYLLDLLREKGATVCSWQEYAFEDKSDPLGAEAFVALAHATTVRTAGILLDQYHGAFGKALDAITAAFDARDTKAALTGLDELVGRAPLGRHLTTPWRVVVAGAPNVGKSSLVNALAGYARSVVDPTPGTTRDVVTVRIAVDGWPIELADTAGLRAEAGPLEALGMTQARTALLEADLCLWVLDASTEPVWPSEGERAVRLVVNKTDLAPTWNLSRAGDAVQLSAKTGERMAELCAALAQWLVPDVPPAGAAVPFTSTLCNGIEVALQVLRMGNADEAKAHLVTLRGRVVGP